MKRTFAVALLFAFAPAIVGQNPPPPSAETTKVTAADAQLRKLSRRERKEKVAKLDLRHQEFISDTEAVMAAYEVDTFLMLETDAQRDSFVDDFWRRRAALHRTSPQVYRDAYYERLAVVKEQFRSASSDRAKMFLLHGAPVRMLRPDCQKLLQPTEIWQYAHLPQLGANVRVVFYRPRGAGDYRLWNPVGGSMALSELLVREVQSAEEANPRATAGPSASPYAAITRIQLECRDGDEFMRAITQMIQGRVELMHLFDPPGNEQEDSKSLLRSLVVANPSAPRLTSEFSVAFPAKEGSRTGVQMTLLVPRSELTAAAVSGAEVYTLDVTGEVLRDGNLWEKYRYRFDYPGDVELEKLPVVIDRLLRPDDYVVRVKVTDASTGAEALVERSITVPEIFTPVAIAAAEEEDVATPAAAAAALAAAPVSKEPRLRILPPAEEIVSGLRPVEALVSGEGIKAVEFWLDGRKLAVRRSPPFSLDMDFGIVPQSRRIRAIGLDESGRPLTGDELWVNSGTDPFRVRIASPRIAPQISGQVRVELDVKVPEGEELESVEFYWNETRLATLYGPPFIQTVTLPDSRGAAYLRAVAKLKDDAVAPTEDVVMINTPAYMEQLDVHLVELPTTVILDGKPAAGLTEADFKLFDSGKPVAISKFEYVRNLPLSLGIAFDTSASMTTRMEEAQKAGAQFVANVMKKGDKAFLVGFDKEPRLVQKWSRKVADMHAGLARMRPESSTALFDAIVHSLYNFHGVQGQRALIVISDGKDTSSAFTFDQAIEYARRSGVPIYPIGISIRGNDADARYKLGRFASETGGTVYYVEQARDLQRVYEEIEAELRSQYVLGFYPPADAKSGSKWREVEVKVGKGKARTVKGYFP